MAPSSSTPTSSPVTPAGFFALRTPLLPFAELSSFSDGLGAAAADPAALAEALAADRTRLRLRLAALLARPEVEEAIFLASPSLHASVPAWRETPDSERGQKVERSLVRYLGRMTARATPFGLFAGCSVGTLGPATALTLGPRALHRRHTRLDHDYLSQLCDALLADPQIRGGVLHRPSSSLYRAAGRLRYVEARRLGERRRTYHLVAVEPSPPLEATLARARDGARLDALAAALVADDAEIAPDEAAEFVAQLAEAQLLVADLAPQVTGPEPIHDVIAQLAPLAPASAAALDETRAALAALDAAPLGVAPAHYRAIAERLAALPAPVELARLFQVDLVKPAPRATLGPAPLAELLRAVEALRRITPRPRDGAMARFAAAFTARYEGRRVALAEALDEESGIGFERSQAPGAEASPLLADLVFPRPEADEGAPLDVRDRLLLRKIDAAARAGRDEIVLEPADLAALAEDEPPTLPTSCAALATLAAADDEALGRGEFLLHFHGLAGPSGANLLGRFCHGDADLTERVRAYLRAEEAERPDACFAEIVHLPQGRVGNVLLRPLLRGYEIGYLGRSGAPAEAQLGLDDLELSVEGGRVRLWSRRLQREVIPRLTTAHAFRQARNLGIYRFLCALAEPERASVGFGWGGLAALPRLPRVRLGKVVLALRRWRIDAGELAALTAAGDATARFAEAQALRARWRLPRWVAAVEHDHVLPIDLENTLFVDTFAQLVKGERAVELTELFAPEQLCARGPEGAFTHELVVPLHALAAPRATSVVNVASASPAAPPRLARSFPPGSEWLYAKLYCGTGSADRVLVEHLAPAVARARAAGAVDDWFFLRYRDPESHVRLRLHGAPVRLAAEVQPLVSAAAAEAMAAGLVWRLQLDTYERELERYGGDAGMRACEAIFSADSEAVLGILGLLEGDAGADARWRLTLRGIDQLLDDLGLTLDDKLALMDNLRAGFGRELHVDGGFERQLGARFRAERAALEALLDRRHDGDSELAPGLERLATRSARIAGPAAELRAGGLTRTLSDLAGSLAHMHANRLLRDAARAQELVIYDFLLRLYQGARARRRPA